MNTVRTRNQARKQNEKIGNIINQAIMILQTQMKKDTKKVGDEPSKREQKRKII